MEAGGLAVYLVCHLIHLYGLALQYEEAAGEAGNIPVRYCQYRTTFVSSPVPNQKDARNRFRIQEQRYKQAKLGVSGGHDR
jgi:hypothetical protein